MVPVGVYDLKTTTVNITVFKEQANAKDLA